MAKIADSIKSAMSEAAGTAKILYEEVVDFVVPEKPTKISGKLGRKSQYDFSDMNVGNARRVYLEPWLDISKDAPRRKKPINEVKYDDFFAAFRLKASAQTKKWKEAYVAKKLTCYEQSDEKSLVIHCSEMSEAEMNKPSRTRASKSK